MIERRGLYPDFEPRETGMLDVGDGHALYWERSGTPHGKPVVFLHGGPGGGSSPKHRRQFDPARYDILVFDQRGAGRSTPHAGLEANTTWHLVDDIERLRTHFGVDKWMVFGGSWGSTLGLAYAQTHPERVTGMILRGIFLARKTEVSWTFGDGARRVYPEGWDEFVAPLSARERGDVLRAYHRRLMSDDAAERREAALSWNLWEERASKLVPEIAPPDEENIERDIALARIEAHYFVNDSFLAPTDKLLRDVSRIRHIPGVIVQGRYDIVCPPVSAWELHGAWPESRLEIVPSAGHAADEPGITDALVRATEEFKNVLVPR